MAETARELATVEEVAAVETVPGVSLLKVSVLGWTVLMHGDVQKGAKCVFFQPDSLVPPESLPKSLQGRARHKLGDKQYLRVQVFTAKGIVSEGMVIPITEFPDLGDLPVGTNVVEQLGVKKYAPEDEGIEEKAVPDKQPFPTGLVPKTDQEVLASLSPAQMEELFGDHRVCVQEKIDGMSATVVHVPGEDPQVCSRRFGLPYSKDDVYWAACAPIIDALQKEGKQLAVQAEIIGPKINGNLYKLTANTICIFDIFEIETRRYYNPTDMVAFCIKYGLPHVPILAMDISAKDYKPQDFLKLLVEGKMSAYAKDCIAEGVVVKRMNQKAPPFWRKRTPLTSAKIISAEYKVGKDR